MKTPDLERLPQTDRFVTRIFDLLDDKWVNSQDLETLMSEFSINNTLARIDFLRELTQFLRLTPEEIFIDQEQRQNWIEVSQRLLDQSIEQEEIDLASH